MSPGRRTLPDHEERSNEALNNTVWNPDPARPLAGARYRHLRPAWLSQLRRPFQRPILTLTSLDSEPLEFLFAALAQLGSQPIELLFPTFTQLSPEPIELLVPTFTQLSPEPIELLVLAISTVDPEPSILVSLNRATFLHAGTDSRCISQLDSDAFLLIESNANFTQLRFRPFRQLTKQQHARYHSHSGSDQLSAHRQQSQPWHDATRSRLRFKAWKQLDHRAYAGANS